MEKIVLEGTIEVNCYIIAHEDKVMLIDPGSDYETLNETLKGRIVEKILLTHGHMDHIDLIGKYKCPIYIHSEDVKLLESPDLSCYSVLDMKPSFDYHKLDIKQLNDGHIVEFYGEKFKLIHTPGHTKGSSCFLNKNRLYSGDTLFKQSVGRTDLPTGSQSDIKNSVTRLIDTLPADTIVYPGHGPNTTIKDEMKENRYYLIWKKQMSK